MNLWKYFKRKDNTMKNHASITKMNDGYLLTISDSTDGLPADALLIVNAPNKDLRQFAIENNCSGKE